MAQQTINVGTSNKSGDGEALRTAFIKTNENFTELYDSKTPSEIVFVSDLSDLPDPVSSVITLQDNFTYFFTSNVDLTGNRILSGDNTTIIGASSENCSITSTGLGVGVPLITSTKNTPIRNIAIKDVDTALDFDGFGNTMALDWTGVNFVNVSNIGTIKDFSNFIFSKGAFLNSKGLEINGNYNTFSIDNSLLLDTSGSGNLINILSTANCNVRTRIIYSSVVSNTSDSAINLDASMTISDESFILDTVSFSGGGTYLGGLDEDSNKSLFVNCKGINNTFVNGQLYMQNNATATVISASDTFYKVLGTTTPSVDNSKFTHTDNRLTCAAAIERKYLIQCALSFETGNNKDCEFGFYDSTLSSIRTPSRTKATSSGTGNAQSISFACVVNFVSGDFLEIHCSNLTDTTDITVTDMNFVITEIG